MQPAPGPEAASPDRRSLARRRVVKTAKIAFGDFVFVHDAVLRDAAPDGSRIRLDGFDSLPDEFYVILTVERVMHRARVVWRRKGEVGVRYEGAPQDIARDPDPRLKQFQFG